MLVVGAGLFAYRNSLHGTFIFDDLAAIEVNSQIRDLWPPWNALSPPPGTAVTARPIVNLSLALNYALGGLSVWGYHAANLAIHLLAALALCGVVRRTLLGPSLRERYGSEALWIALAVALIWVVHPLQTESVTYIIQRTELLMGLFFLLTLYCVIRGAESPRPGAWYAAAVVSNVLGAGSKEVMVVAPVVVLAYDRLFLSASFRETFRRRWGLYAGLAAGWLVLGALEGRRIGGGFAHGAARGVPPWDYAVTQSGVIAHYLRLAFWPHPLVGDYDDWPFARSLVSVLPQAVVVLTLLGATAWALCRRSRLGFLGVWFFLVLAPTSSVYPLLGEVAAERRMYLPVAAVIALVVIGGHMALGKIWRRLGWQPDRLWFVAAVLLVAIVGALAHITERRSEDYRSAAAFWSDVVAKRPRSARGQLGLGEHLLGEGKIDEALGHLAEAVRIKPGDPTVHYTLGLALASQGKLEEAIGHYREALRIAPDFVEALNNLGAALARQGKLDEATVQYREAVRLNPRHATAQYNLAVSLASQGNYEEAVGHYREALGIEPDSAAVHNNLAVALASQGKLDEAIGHYRDAIRIDPDYAQAHNNLGTALASQGKLDDAIARYREALRINPGYAQARANLAAALARRERPR